MKLSLSRAPLFALVCRHVLLGLVVWPARAVKLHGGLPSLPGYGVSEQPGFVAFDPRKSSVRIGSCKDVKCPQGWALSVDLSSPGNETHMCCEKTCELWTCSAGYVSNPDYSTNIAQSDQACCDRACGNFTCRTNYSQASTLTAGTTHDECCLVTCVAFECLGNWKTDSSRAGIVAANESSCCRPTCARFNCSGAAGWVTDTSKLDVGGDKFGDCCFQECRIVNCLEKGETYGVPDERMDWTNGTDACCANKCKGHSCGTGWLPNVSKADYFGESNEDCCTPQECQQKHAPCNLSEGWADSTASDEPYCCQATCKRWDCEAADQWLASASKANITAASNEDCCERSCLHHVCTSAMVHIPQSNATRGNTDSQCCEDAGCSIFRDNLTQLADGAYCNSVGESSQCEARFEKLGNSTLVPCQWDAGYGLCRNDLSRNVTGCFGF